MKQKVLSVIVLAALFGLLAAGSLSAAPVQPEPVVAAPPLARITTINTAAIDESTNFSNYDWSVYTYLDLFYRVTDGASVNTMTLEIEVSPDGTNWYDHALSGTLVSGIATTTNSYVGSIPVQGAQYRIVATVDNTNSVTPNLKGVLRY